VLKQSGSELQRIYFEVPGFDSASVEYEYSVPGSYDGELNLRAQIDPTTVNPPGGPQDDIDDDFQTLTLNVEGTSPKVRPSETSSSFTGDMLVPLAVIGVLILGLGGAFFMYKRSQTGGDLELEQEDPFGAMPGTTPPAAPPPPVPEQPPPAAAPPPPVPEQPPPAAPGNTVLTVAVPAGAQPGQQIQIKAPDGRVVTVAIPAGLQPGQQFQIKV